MEIIRDTTKFKVLKSVDKSIIYDTIHQLIISNGWEDISSLPSKDYNVYYSEGSDGKQKIYMQLRNSYDGTEIRNIQTSTERYIGMRMLMDYTPGIAGVEGTIITNTTWLYVTIIARSSIMGPKSLINVYYNITKDRIIFIFEDIYSKEAYYMYTGKPKPSYSKTYSNTGMVSCCYNQAFGGGSTLILGVADSLEKNYVVGNLMVHNFAKSTNANGQLMLSEIGFEYKDTGFMGYLDGIYAIDVSYSPAEKEVEEYIIKNGERYRIFKGAPVVGGGNWNSNKAVTPFFAIRLEDETS